MKRDEIPMHRCWKLSGELDRLVVRQGSYSQLGHPLPSVWRKYEVAIDENANRETRSYGQSMLDVETASNHLLSGLV